MRKDTVDEIAKVYPQASLTPVPTSSICTHMLETTWKLRVSEEELKTWKAYAAERGMILSEWVRDTLNTASEQAPIPVSVKAPSKRVDKDAPKAIPVCECGHRRADHGGFGTACTGELGSCKCQSFAEAQPIASQTTPPH